MGLSGFIYVAIVLGWAVYLVPGAVRRYEEASRNRSVERFSSRMRLLGREDRAATAESDTPAPAADLAPAPRGPEQRAAARTAARRRRRVLLLLLCAAAATAVAAGLSMTSWWSVAAPAGLVVVWLAACRGQARRESDVCWARDGGYVEPDAADLHRTNRLEPPRADDEVTSQGGPLPAAASAGAPDLAEPPVDVAPNDEPTVVLEHGPGAETGPEEADGGSLWDPVPVTLPTYVHKPRAHRTIRTVDLAGSGGGQSPRRFDESAIYTHRVERSSRSEEAEPAPAEDADASDEHKGPARRAVGE